MTDFVDDLANVLFSDAENIQRASEYVKTRGLDLGKFAFPWLATGSNAGPFEVFRAKYPPVIFTDCLYIPIVSMDSTLEAPVIDGWDIRYLGDEPHRLRWSKRKREPEKPELIYGAHSILKSDFLIVTESAMDSESFMSMGYSSISTLTAKAPPKICHFLYATGCEIFIAFDNDEGGRSATKKILEVVSKYPKAAKKFHILNYPYQDPNHCLMKIGPGKFVDKIKFQLPLAGI